MSRLLTTASAPLAAARSRAIALVVAIALAVVALAPLWHTHQHTPAVAAACSGCGHHHGPDGSPPVPSQPDQPAHHNHDCAVCLALLSPVGDGLGTDIKVPRPALQPLIRQSGPRVAAVTVQLPRQRSRGPPRLSAIDIPVTLVHTVTLGYGCGRGGSSSTQT